MNMRDSPGADTFIIPSVLSFGETDGNQNHLSVYRNVAAHALNSEASVSIPCTECILASHDIPHEADSSGESSCLRSERCTVRSDRNITGSGYDGAFSEVRTESTVHIAADCLSLDVLRFSAEGDVTACRFQFGFGTAAFLHFDIAALAY